MVNRAIIKSTLLIVGVFIGILFIIINTRTPQLKPKKIIKSYDISEFLKDGDVICRLGDRFWSLYFKDISPIDKRFSHLGIIHINNNVITVINAEGRAIEGKDFVNEVALQDFLNSARSIGIYRLKDYDGKLVSDTAIEYIGRPFDWDFNIDEEEKLYCSELLYAVLKRIAPEITLKTKFQKEIGRELLPLEACSHSPYFEEILYLKTDTPVSKPRSHSL